MVATPRQLYTMKQLKSGLHLLLYLLGSIYDYYFHKQASGSWNSWTDYMDKSKSIIAADAKVRNIFWSFAMIKNCRVLYLRLLILFSRYTNLLHYSLVLCSMGQNNNNYNQKVGKILDDKQTIYCNKNLILLCDFYFFRSAKSSFKR